MALTKVQSPTFAGQTDVLKNRNNFLPREAFHKPIWQEVMFRQAKKWWLQPFLQNKVGENDPIQGRTWNWVEKGKSYGKQLVSAVAANGDDYDITLQSGDQYFMVYDIVDLGVTLPGSNVLNLHAQVRAVSKPSANQIITVTLLEGSGDLSGYDLTAHLDSGDEIALKTNAQTECFTVPDSRLYTPEKFSNSLNKIANSIGTCDDADDQILWFQTGDGQMKWMPLDMETLADIHRMHVDSAIWFGQDSTFVNVDNSNYEGVTGKGLMQQLDERALIMSFAGGLIERDMADLLTELGIYSKENMWHMIGGPQICADAMFALKDYAIGGGIMYGDFAPAGGNTVGLNFKEYNFGGRRLRLMEYQGFADPDFLPANAGKGMDYSNLAVVLALEGDSIKLQYGARNRGGKWKDHFNYRPGHGFADDGQIFISDQACLENMYRTDVSVEVKGNDHAVIHIE